MQTLHLIGYGKMAEAILVACKERFAFCIHGRDIKKARLLADKYGVACTVSTEGFDSPLHIDGKLLLLAIKPYALCDFATVGCADSVYSVLAGVQLEILKSHIPAVQHVRAMPNIAAAFQKSCTALYAEQKNSLAEEIFGLCGDIIWLSSESKFDAAMAISGCSPAYLAMVAEALSDAGVREGLSREEANAFVKGLFCGFPSLLAHKHPAHIKEEVSSPAGATIEGVAYLESCSFRSALIEAIHCNVKKIQR